MSISKFASKGLLEKRGYNPVASAYATSPNLKGSVYKASQLAGLIRKSRVQDAMLQLQFNRKSLSRHFIQTLNSAIANAENNAGLDIDNLYISEILVEKAFDLKRNHARGRGRSAMVKKHYVRVKILLKSL